ncbi:MAG: hypothetical protein U1E62_13265 [Alsobacter sp.]
MATFAAGVAALFLFVAIVDPYDTLALSPAWKRHRVSGNERFSFPGLVRHGRFDSAVFGTSTVMLLDPKRLDALFGGSFANLAMGSATAWEQAQLMDYFRTHAPQVRTLIVAMDVSWCSPDRPAPALTFRPFPPWQYDEEPWNDYAYLLNTRALAHAVRQALVLSGLARPGFRSDGYFQFVPDDSLYDPRRARRELWGDRPRQEPPPDRRPVAGPAPPDWTFPDLAMLERTLSAMPASSLKVLMFAPYHVSVLATEEARRRYAHCKSAVTALAGRVPNTAVVDFMIPNSLTRDDTAYWDPLHYRIDHARELEAALAEAVLQGRSSGDLYEVLARP